MKRLEYYSIISLAAGGWRLAAGGWLLASVVRDPGSGIRDSEDARIRGFEDQGFTISDWGLAIQCP
jgi:hypothetical protein